MNESLPEPTPKPTVIDSNVANGDALTVLGAPPPVIGPSILGYDVLDRLGAGGMGVVWRAVQRSTRRVVALKVMGAAALGSERARLRFEREVELAARLDHPGIARVYDGGLDAGACYCAMELIDGAPLDEHVRGAGLGPREVVALVRDVCRAVQHAHQRGVIHRDLKPSNILVTPAGGPKVLDFGLAKAVAGDDGDGGGRPDVSIAGEVAGTPGYMSPEQADGRAHHADTRSDVYSLGVVLFYSLSGEYPHDMTGPLISVIRRVAEQEPRRLRDLPGVARPAPELEAILSKALAREPDRRYATAAGLADDLTRYLAGDAVSARPPTLTYLLRKRAKRYRVPIAAAAGVLAALGGLAAYSYVRVTAERNAAVEATAEKERQRGEAERQRAEADRQHGEADRSRAEAVRQGGVAESRRAEAEVARGEERAQRRAAEQHLAESLVAQADALMGVDQGGPAEARLGEAREVVVRLGLPTDGVDLAFWDLRRRFPPPLATFDRQVDALAFMPDGRTLLQAVYGEVFVRDAVSGRTVRTFRAHGKAVRAMVVSADGTRLLTGGEDHVAKLWDLPAGRLLATHEHPGECRGVALLPDGQTAVSSGSGADVDVWDAATGRTLRTLRPRTEQKPERRVNRLAVSRDGRLLLACGLYPMAHLWDLPGGRLLHEWNEGERAVEAADLAPDGLSAAIALPDSTIRVYDPATWTERYVLRGHTGKAEALAYSADARRLASRGRDGIVRVWDPASARAIGTLVLAGWGRDVAFSPDGSLVAAGVATWAGPTRLAVWGLAPSQEVRRHVARSQSTVLATSPDGRSGAWLLPDGHLGVVDLATGRTLRALPMGLAALAAFTADGRGLIAKSPERIAAWDVASGRQLWERPRRGPDEDFSAVAFAADGSRFAVKLSGGRAAVFDARTRESVRTLTSPGAPLVSLALASDGRTVVAGTAGGTVVIWDATSNAAPRTVPMASTHNVWGVAVSPDGRTCLAGSADGQAALVDLQGGTRRAVLAGHVGSIPAVAFAPDGRLALTGSADRHLKVWDVASGAAVRTLDVYDDEISRATFTPNGRGIVTLDRGGAATVIDLSTPAAYRDWERRLADARRRPGDPDSMATLGEWYAFRGRNDWAAELLAQARTAGTTVSPLTLGRCYWQLGKTEDARRELTDARKAAADDGERYYLDLCLSALGGPPAESSATK